MYGYMGNGKWGKRQEKRGEGGLKLSLFSPAWGQLSKGEEYDVKIVARGTHIDMSMLL